MSGRRVVITGASGFVGGALCAHFASRGWDVRALVRDPAVFTARTGIPAGRCDLPEILDTTVLDGALALVHCAWATRETDPARAGRVNEEGSRRLLAAARTAAVPRFVFVSTVAASPDAPSYYARSKHAVEGLLDPARDLVIRPGLVVGRGGHGLFQQLLDNMRRTRVVPLFGGGRQPLQTVHVDDVSAAIEAALERSLVGAFNVAELEAPSLRHFLRGMAARAGVRCAFIPLPFGPVLTGLRVLEALHVPFPLRSESLLGLKGLRRVPVAEDLRRLGITVRPADASLADVLGPTVTDPA
ncbi:MAG TPA: NAD-dependent epimerase/dehydratase family protein [Candidatus Binatia bacterium]|nr:NAD-dependent epimerase/dehydratase family protein [Candidatus Binatia bacterium]